MITSILLRFWLALNQSTCLMITGQNDLTISGWSYLRFVYEGKPRWNDFVNWLFKTFKNQDDHCLHALRWEYQQAEKQRQRLQAAYDVANAEIRNS